MTFPKGLSPRCVRALHPGLYKGLGENQQPKAILYGYPLLVLWMSAGLVEASAALKV